MQATLSMYPGTDCPSQKLCGKSLKHVLCVCLDMRSSAHAVNVKKCLSECMYCDSKSTSTLACSGPATIYHLKAVGFFLFYLRCPVICFGTSMPCLTPSVIALLRLPLVLVYFEITSLCITSNSWNSCSFSYPFHSGSIEICSLRTLIFKKVGIWNKCIPVPWKEP